MEENREILVSKEELIGRIEKQIEYFESNMKSDFDNLSKIPGYEDAKDAIRIVASLKERLQNLKN